MQPKAQTGHGRVTKTLASSFVRDRAHAVRMMSANQQSRNLNAMVVSCRDAGRTYRRASAAHPSVHDELLKLSRQRSAYVVTLSTLARAAGSSPSNHGSPLGWIRQSLFALRVVMLGQSHLGDSLRACATQDRRTAEVYSRALTLAWPTELRLVLGSQLREIRESHSYVRHLQKSL